MLEGHTPGISETNRPSPTDIAHALFHPEDVLSHPDLTVARKREILAAWASDAHAVPDAPGLRQIDSGAVVSVDAILDALRRLDPADRTIEPAPKRQDPYRRRQSSLIRCLRHWNRHSDDDDDPPPCPAAALPLDLELARRRKWEIAPEPLAA